VKSLRQINALPPLERDQCYLSIVPPLLCQRFGLDPVAFTDPLGRPVARVEARPGEASVRLTVRHRWEAPDPALFLRLAESRYGHLQISFIILSDPHGPRFGVDLDEEGQATDLGALSRNRREEESAMRAGLAPGQIRPGLRMLGATLDRIEALAAHLGKAALLLEAFFYHNAVLYERQGFGYLAGRERMEEIHQGFSPGGRLEALLDGRTPFRCPGAGASVRGRSWAIHDGILSGFWWPPVMYRPVGARLAVCTTPDLSF
jgi:hypothetical protein